MLSGTPVVASNLPGVRVPIQLTKMGKIVAPKNPKQLSQAISEILKNKNKFNNDKLIKKLLKNIFDINNVFKFYDNLIIMKYKKISIIIPVYNEDKYILNNKKVLKSNVFE